jgi:hypothetical protein
MTESELPQRENWQQTRGLPVRYHTKNMQMKQEVMKKKLMKQEVMKLTMKKLIKKLLE